MEARAVLSSDTGSVRLARAFVVSVLEEWRANVDIADVQLATAEVVTNALVHVGSRVGVTVRLVGDVVRVEVADASDRPPVVRHPLPEVPSGRGMGIVEAVTDRWGVEYPAAGGKAVWFSVSARGRGRPAAAAPGDC